MAVTIRVGFQRVTVPLLASRDGAPFPVLPGVVVGSSDEAALPVVLLPGNLVQASRGVGAAGPYLISATGGGLLAQMQVIVEVPTNHAVRVTSSGDVRVTAAGDTRVTE